MRSTCLGPMRRGLLYLNLIGAQSKYPRFYAECLLISMKRVGGHIYKTIQWP